MMGDLIEIAAHMAERAEQPGEWFSQQIQHWPVTILWVVVEIFTGE